MAYLFQPGSWTSAYSPTVTDYQNIAADIATRGDTLDFAHYGAANASFFTLVPGDLPATSYTVSAASWSGGTATLTLTGSSNIQVGQRFSVSSITPSGYNSADAIATSGTTGTTLKYAVTSNPGSYVSGGTVLVDRLSTPANGMIAIDQTGALKSWNGSAWVGLASGITTLTSDVSASGSGSVAATVVAIHTTSSSTVGATFATTRSSVTLANGLNSNITLPTTPFAKITGPSASFSIGGFTGGADGVRFTLFNPTLQAMTIVHADASSSAANRIYSPTQTNIILGGLYNSCITFVYDTGSSNWIPVSWSPVPSLQPAQVNAYNSTNQSITSASETAILYDTNNYDTTGMHSTVTNTSRFTCQAGYAGKYLFQATVKILASSAGTTRYIALKKNGTTYYATVEVAPPSAGNLVLNVVAFIDLVATDYVETVVYQDSGGALNVGTSTAGTAAMRLSI